MFLLLLGAAHATGFGPEFKGDPASRTAANLFSLDAENQIPINPGLAGAWGVLGADSQGFLFDINDDLGFVFAAWFTYDPEPASASKSVGAEEQFWLTVYGPYDGVSADLTVGLSSDGLFASSVATGLSEVGTAQLSFSDCFNGSMSYSFRLPNGAEQSGVMQLSRLTPDSFCQPFVASQPITEVKVLYLGNEGVLVTDGNESVVLDGIGNYSNPWINVPVSTQNTIRDMNEPFDQVVAVTISHQHSDHFNIAPVADFINQNSASTLFVPEDTRSFFTALGSQVDGTSLNRFESSSRQLGGIKITTIETRHFNQFGFDFSGIENNVYVVEMAGKRIIHMGDVDYAADNFQAIVDAFEGPVDAIILPMFNTLVSQANAALVAEFFPDALIIASHIRAGNQSDLNNIQVHFPDAIVFDQPLMEVTL
ncbi:MBL fold metallo-hydrolase [Marinicella meishanensis]|uniref:MBL fold metallo-hydrolase n=1 Tax=Marinicella meishanensis TaxID=2873263 RepID=UPI001CBACE43|nr:MBL fold metallo-hydrolase [Marinicella sp. NBU2979]